MTLTASRILVLGCGRAGASAATALVRMPAGPAVHVWDELDVEATRGRAAQLRPLGLSVTLGAWQDSLLEGITMVVKSPGISFGHEAIVAAGSRGIRVFDELEVGFLLGGARPWVVVTGTDGKSTVCSMIASALGFPGPPATVAGNTQFGPPLTSVTPGDSSVVVEASSYQLEGISQTFAAVAVLTNITKAHLNRHRTLDAYAAAKARAFLVDDDVVPRAVLPSAGRYARRIAAEVRARGAVVSTFGTSAASDYRLVSSTWTTDEGEYRLSTPRGTVEFRTPHVGFHNGLNIAASLAACDLLGLPATSSTPAIEGSSPVPGRWERMDVGAPYTVIVDFAHTPAALKLVLATARKSIDPNRKVHLVLSTPGGVGPDYRAELGATACRGADRVVVTEASHRGEPREQAITDICAGFFRGGATREVVVDRREAIAHAMRGAGEGDIVLIVNRGALPVLQVDTAGSGRPFDDRVVAREELAKLHAAPTPY